MAGDKVYPLVGWFSRFLNDLWEVDTRRKWLVLLVPIHTSGKSVIQARLGRPSQHLLCFLNIGRCNFYVCFMKRFGVTCGFFSKQFFKSLNDVVKRYGSATAPRLKIS